MRQGRLSRQPAIPKRARAARSAREGSRPEVKTMRAGSTHCYAHLSARSNARRAVRSPAPDR